METAPGGRGGEGRGGEGRGGEGRGGEGREERDGGDEAQARVADMATLNKYR